MWEWRAFPGGPVVHRCANVPWRSERLQKLREDVAQLRDLLARICARAGVDMPPPMSYPVSSWGPFGPDHDKFVIVRMSDGARRIWSVPQRRGRA